MSNNHYSKRKTRIENKPVIQAMNFDPEKTPKKGRGVFDALDAIFNKENQTERKQSK